MGNSSLPFVFLDLILLFDCKNLLPQVVLNNSNALQKSGAYKFFKKYLGSGLILASGKNETT